MREFVYMQVVDIEKRNGEEKKKILVQTNKFFLKRRQFKNQIEYQFLLLFACFPFIMSAFAALKNNPFGESIFNNTKNGDNHSRDDVEEDEVVQYIANSSDEDDDDDDDDNDNDQGNEDNNLFPLEISAPEDTSISSTPAPILNSRITQSNYTPNESNLKFSDNHVTITLNPSEYIIISGQCNLKIIKGSIKINQCHCLTSEDNKSYNIIALQSQSLPIISHYTTPEMEEDGVPSVSIIQLENSFSGIENISQIEPAFKNLISGQPNVEEPSLFKNYSFDIVLTETNGGYGLDINSYWINELNLLKSNKDGPTPKIIMIIGNKNTGKSTFCKSLINELLLTNPNRPVSYLEIDPGQSEYSTPYALSLSEIVQAQFGLVALPHKNNNIVKSRVEHYFGFTSAVNAPTRYVEIIEELFNHYQTKFSQRNHLIINTPGWVKGYGKELLNQITKIINPDKLILLSNNLNQEYPDNANILQDLTYQSLSIIPGVYQLSKYSAPQIRTINKLLYFHQTTTTGTFNFNDHLLDSSPLKISYACGNSPNNPGIYSTTIINHNIDNEFSHRDLCSLVEVSIYGIYLIKSNGSTKFDEMSCFRRDDGNSPFYLNPDDFDNLLSNETITSKFIGLIMVHSINPNDHYMNIYAPDIIINRLRKVLSTNSNQTNDYKLIMIRGEGDIPNCEMLYPEFINKKIDYLKLIKKRKAATTSRKLVDLKLPYISFETKLKVGGIWKVRKNIKRRGHH